MIKLLGLSKIAFVPIAPTYNQMMTRNLPKRHSKNVFTIDFTDELLKEKRTYDAIGKSDETVCKSLILPSINRPSEMSPSYMQSKGLELRQSRDLPSICCISEWRVAVLQRSQQYMPLFML